MLQTIFYHLHVWPQWHVLFDIDYSIDIKAMPEIKYLKVMQKSHVRSRNGIGDYWHQAGKNHCHKNHLAVKIYSLVNNLFAITHPLFGGN